MFTGRQEFQVDGAETEKAREEEKSLVIPNGLAGRVVLEERRSMEDRPSGQLIQRDKEVAWSV